MSLFVDPSITKEYRFQDPDGNPAVIWYRAKMDLGMEARLQEELLKIRLENAANGDSQEQQSD